MENGETKVKEKKALKKVTRAARWGHFLGPDTHGCGYSRFHTHGFVDLCCVFVCVFMGLMYPGRER